MKALTRQYKQQSINGTFLSNCPVPKTSPSGYYFANSTGFIISLQEFRPSESMVTIKSISG